MKHLGTLVFVAVFILLSSSDSMGQFYTGNELVVFRNSSQLVSQGKYQFQDSLRAGQYIGFVAGVFDATDYMHETPKGITVAQLMSIVGKFLDDNPERLHEPA